MGLVRGMNLTLCPPSPLWSRSDGPGYLHLTPGTLKNSVTLKIEKHVMLFIWCFEKLKTVRVIGSGILCGGLVATSSQCDWTLFEVPFRFLDRRDFTKIILGLYESQKQFSNLFCTKLINFWHKTTFYFDWMKNSLKL